MSVFQMFLVVKSNLLSILMPAKVVKIFDSQNIAPQKLLQHHQEPFHINQVAATLSPLTSPLKTMYK